MLLNEILNEMDEFKKGDVVYINPEVVGKDGGVGKVLKVKGPIVTVMNYVDNKEGEYQMDDVMDLDNVPEEWVTPKAEKLATKI